MFIDINAKAPLRKINVIAGRLDDPTELMQDIGDVMMDSVEENFRQEGRPEWAKLSEHTTKKREKKGKWPGKILQVDGLLAASIGPPQTIRHHRGTFEVAVGTNYPSAPTHQFGAEEGEYGSTSSGRPIPFGDIPARPFLTLGEPQIDEIGELAADYVDV